MNRAHTHNPRRYTARRLVAGLLTALAPCAIAAPDPAEMRIDSEEAVIVRTWSGTTLETQSLESSPVSLTITQPGGPLVLGWHEVHDIAGLNAEQSSGIAPLLTLGRNIWRADTRLARGDSFGAEPLFEDAFERTRGSVGPTPALVADGLLRCRLRRDARAAAIDAWLELAANLASAPAALPRWGLRSPAVDARTRLVPALPPIWFESPAARAFAESPPPGTADGTTTYADAIRDLYRASAQHAVNLPFDPSRVARAAEIAGQREGGSLVAAVVLAQIGGEEVRQNARETLAREHSTGEDRWRAVWASIGIGRSLIREPDEADQRRGLLELLAVHAIDADVSPYLTGIALADAARAAQSLGDLSAEHIILGDLRRDYPDHPVRQLPGLAQVPVTPGDF